MLGSLSTVQFIVIVEAKMNSICLIAHLLTRHCTIVLQYNHYLILFTCPWKLSPVHQLLIICIKQKLEEMIKIQQVALKSRRNVTEIKRHQASSHTKFAKKSLFQLGCSKWLLTTSSICLQNHSILRVVSFKLKVFEGLKVVVFTVKFLLIVLHTFSVYEQCYLRLWLSVPSLSQKKWIDIK